MTDSLPARSGPVTVCITQQVIPGREQDFEVWLQGIAGVAEQFAGHQGIEVLRPAPGKPQEYTYIFRFDSFEHLQKWEHSNERDKWVAKLSGVTKAAAKRQMLTGLEYWFTLPGGSNRPAPPRYKMALVTLLAIYPLTTLLSWLLGPLLGSTPTLLRALAVSVLAVFLMTYVIMPRLTRLFAKWLFPNK